MAIEKSMRERMLAGEPYRAGLVEGPVAHRMQPIAPFPRDATRAAVARAVAPPPGSAPSGTPTPEPEGRP